MCFNHHQNIRNRSLSSIIDLTAFDFYEVNSHIQFIINFKLLLLLLLCLFFGGLKLICSVNSIKMSTVFQSFTSYSSIIHHARRRRMTVSKIVFNFLLRTHSLKYRVPRQSGFGLFISQSVSHSSCSYGSVPNNKSFHFDNLIKRAIHCCDRLLLIIIIIIIYLMICFKR